MLRKRSSWSSLVENRYLALEVNSLALSIDNNME